ncbi:MULTISPECIES: WecB/TagA/CpsF family glycosyltransferase [Ramlibacter]|uniref:WecB/TagA/CpsF family glycosyltransferase n=1 Tax=Ramlibacter pinisoli TaxID=2682844 RepID=A0A6N8IQ56_9BURK|nr:MULTISPECIES: WecB/TagA/CpsF family glycosyltransferase [Ramlibacter]MBA2963453.1 WecB/TagA/CpsF family glycosyltransferase [Ramlibacter sp. CGMCC 1.13660]MVQ28420.1 WecB/TagA/CpsF family glycosyltransferase [Ramlibacter pinisoli]
MPQNFPLVVLCGMALASVRSEMLLDHLFASLARGKGLWVVTANLDFLRRFVKDPAARRIYADADVRVADGMPLVWASHLQGTPLPERVAGSSLVRPLCQRAAEGGWRVYLLGGEAGAARAAADKLVAEFPTLQIAGLSSPWFSARPTDAEVEQVAATLSEARPDLVLVALGSPKQELVIHKLHKRLPNVCWMGVGISLSFIAGHRRRAPPLMQKLGLEWMHRLVQEPKRLFRRYVLEDLPFAAVLFRRAMADRLDGARADRQR